MNVKIDEYLGLMQSTENEGSLTEYMKNLEELRYSSRVYSGNVGNGANREEVINRNRKEMQNISYNNYKNRRVQQIRQLFEAYSNKNNGFMWIESTDTNPSNIRRVIGDKPYNQVYDGNLFMDTDTIEATQAVAELIKDNKYVSGYGGHSLISCMSYYGLTNAIDEIIACQNMLSIKTGKKIGYNEIVKNTNVGKRAIGKVIGRNVFSIEDYQLNAKEVIRKNSGIIGKIRNGFKSLSQNEYSKEKLGEEKIDIEFQEK